MRPHQESTFICLDTPLDLRPYLSTMYNGGVKSDGGGRYRAPSYLFCVRARDERCHDRLVLAAREDGLTVGDELNMLLDLRDQWNELTTGTHPLGRPGYVPPVPALPPVTREPVRDHMVEGIDYWYGRGYWRPVEQHVDQAAS
jgi:hypothetical protein